MDLWESFLLGLIQGITEFLPISSSGHLVLGQYFLGLENNGGITYEIVVHFGSLVSIVAFYRNDIGQLIRNTFELLAKPSVLASPTKLPKEQQLVYLILVSMIPALLVGLFLKSSIESAFESPVWVSAMLFVTGTLLLSTKLASPGRESLGFKHAVGMGLAQAVAILPGISRSGSTIAIGQHLGLSREDGARFSFLMVIPVIAGAMILELGDIGSSGALVDIPVLLIGFITSAVSGYVALSFLIQVIKRFGIHWFALYCYGLGLFCLWYFLM